MSAVDTKKSYTADEIAALIKSVEQLQTENAELRRKLEHMNGKR